MKMGGKTGWLEPQKWSMWSTAWVCVRCRHLLTPQHSFVDTLILGKRSSGYIPQNSNVHSHRPDKFSFHKTIIQLLWWKQRDHHCLHTNQALNSVYHFITHFLENKFIFILPLTPLNIYIYIYIYIYICLMHISCVLLIFEFYSSLFKDPNNRYVRLEYKYCDIHTLC
jgi:hypothetical protein